MEQDKNKKGIEVMIKLPEKVEARIDAAMLIIKGPKGESKKDISNPQLNFEIKENSINISAKRSTKREKKIVHTYEAHVKNMAKGVTEGHEYILKICSDHFPMNVSVNNNQLIIKNFLGEKHPRTLQLREGVNVKVEGDKVSVESPDKELAGTTASEIEQLTRRPNFDTRIFQDGIFIINKAGKEIK